MPTRYPIIGDLDKPFHRCECECPECEAWRETHYPTFSEVLPMAEEVKPDAPPVWAIVSLLGHRQYAGKLSEEEKFGSKVGRIDVIDDKSGVDGFRTVYFTAQSIYSIEFVSEEAARVAARKSMPTPVQPWDFPKQLAAAPEERVDIPFRDEADDDEEEDYERDARLGRY